MSGQALTGGLRPLHVGKFVPPPFAGIESHVDTLLRALAPFTDATDAIDQLIRETTLRHRLGEVARQGVRSEFDVATMRDGTLDIYRKLA